MLKAMRTFAKDDDGAITVDWVVLTALVLGIQIVIMVASMRESLTGVSDSIATKIGEFEDFTK